MQATTGNQVTMANRDHEPKSSTGLETERCVSALVGGVVAAIVFLAVVVLVAGLGDWLGERILRFWLDPTSISHDGRIALRAFCGMLPAFFVGCWAGRQAYRRVRRRLAKRWPGSDGTPCPRLQRKERRFALLAPFLAFIMFFPALVSVAVLTVGVPGADWQQFRAAVALFRRLDPTGILALGPRCFSVGCLPGGPGDFYFGGLEDGGSP